MEKKIKKNNSYQRIEEITDMWINGKIPFDEFLVYIFRGYHGRYVWQKESYGLSIMNVMRDKNLANLKP